MTLKEIGRYSLCALFLMGLGACDNASKLDSATANASSLSDRVDFAVPRDAAIEARTRG